MRLTPELAERVQREYDSASARMRTLNLRLLSELAPTLSMQRSREYMEHGVCRRLKVIHRCMENIVTIFPPHRTEILNSSELSDIQINLHAFVINVYGLLDNVAWVYVLEKDLESQIEGGRAGVGLFNRKTQKYLSPDLCDYLNTETLKSWFTNYAKNYRDALAHRIPLYVPPFSITNAEGERWKALDTQISAAIKEYRFNDIEALSKEQKSIGRVCAAFIHSYSDSDASRPVLLHPQMICDAMTVIDVLEKVSDDVRSNGWYGSS